MIIASIIKIIEKGIPIGFSEEMIPQNIEKKIILFILFKSNNKNIAKFINVKNKASVNIIFEKEV